MWLKKSVCSFFKLIQLSFFHLLSFQAKVSKPKFFPHSFFPDFYCDCSQALSKLPLPCIRPPSADSWSKDILLWKLFASSQSVLFHQNRAHAEKIPFGNFVSMMTDLVLNTWGPPFFARKANWTQIDEEFNYIGEDPYAIVHLDT